MTQTNSQGMVQCEKTNAKPQWWERASPDVHSAVDAFSSKVSAKITNNSPNDWDKLIRRKNPFLFRARAADDAQLFAAMIIDAFLSFSEETMFGTVLEEIALAVCREAKNGRKSSALNIDLEYDEYGRRTIMQVKSGPYWGNSRQRRKLEDDFKTAAKVLRQGTDMHVRAVEGICYGPSRITDRGTHIQIVGYAFWEDISGWNGTGKAVMDIIGEHAGNGLKRGTQSSTNRHGTPSPEHRDRYIKRDNLMASPTRPSNEHTAMTHNHLIFMFELFLMFNG